MLNFIKDEFCLAVITAVILVMGNIVMVPLYWYKLSRFREFFSRKFIPAKSLVQCHSRKFILAKVNFGPKVIAKVYPLESLYQ